MFIEMFRGVSVFLIRNKKLDLDIMIDEVIDLVVLFYSIYYITNKYKFWYCKLYTCKLARHLSKRERMSNTWCVNYCQYGRNNDATTFCLYKMVYFGFDDMSHKAEGKKEREERNNMYIKKDVHNMHISCIVYFWTSLYT